MTDGAEADDEMRNHYMPTQAYRSALEAAGFTDVVIRDPEISPQALAAYESGFRDAMIDRPVFSLIDCRQP